MRNSAETRERIIDAAVGAIAADGLDAFTVGSVASRAQVSSALVHYHFATKDKLLVAAGERLARTRADWRAKAFSEPGGLATLDAIWSSVQNLAHHPVEAAWCELILQARANRDIAAVVAAERAGEQGRVAARLPGLFRELGVRPPAPADELARAILVLLDGLSLALAAGDPRDTLRSAYDAFWLALIAAGQSAIRR